MSASDTNTCSLFYSVLIIVSKNISFIRSSVLIQRSLTTFFPVLFCAFSQINCLISLYGLPLSALSFGPQHLPRYRHKHLQVIDYC